MYNKIAVWFRRDFRLHDHTALIEALEKLDRENGKLLTIFYLDPKTANVTAVHHDYFFQTVMHFKQRLKDMGSDLFIISGTIEEAMKKVIHTHPDLEAIFVNDDRVGEGAIRDEWAANALASLNIPLLLFEDAYLTKPEQVLKKDGTHYRVFTPYYKAWRHEQKKMPRKLDVNQLKAAIVKNSTVIDRTAEKNFEELISTCKRRWEGIGEEEAVSRLQQFVAERLEQYEKNRDYPSVIGTSRLSPYLKTGTLSIRTVFSHVLESENNSYSTDTFLSELAWRDFYRMIHYFYPQCKDQEITEKYRSIIWDQNNDLFKRWIEGQTGFPIVDAGMRQLKREGWMHNRLRMITASFLTKDYLIDWRLGERYFEQMLIDYDPSANIGGWQWAASVGTDSVPYFRVFNPTRQSERFDPLGTYIKKYIPELKHVPMKWIHEPSKMSGVEQNEANCIIGTDYPFPSVDHSVQRKIAISLFKSKAEV